jgi:hypothetical protein
MDSRLIIQVLSNGKFGSTVYKELGSALNDLGFYFSIEMLYLTIYLTVAVVGAILNIFCVFIFFRPAFYSSKSPNLFSYLRFEAMIGIVGNLVGAVYALNICADILPFTNNYPSHWM